MNSSHTKNEGSAQKNSQGVETSSNQRKSLQAREKQLIARNMHAAIWRTCSKARAGGAFGC
jgi:hypothetical protein